MASSSWKEDIHALQSQQLKLHGQFQMDHIKTWRDDWHHLEYKIKALEAMEPGNWRLKGDPEKVYTKTIVGQVANVYI